MCEYSFKINKEITGYKLTDKDISELVSIAVDKIKIRAFQATLTAKPQPFNPLPVLCKKPLGRVRVV